MTTIKLTKKRVIEQLVKYGFFAEMIPNCFSSDDFSSEVFNLIPVLQNAKESFTAPEELSTYKNELSRRALSVPNPESFLRLVKYMGENWGSIVSLANSSNSLSPITFIHEYDGIIGKNESINSEKYRDIHFIKSDFVEGVKERIRVALGFRYRLKVDIANCYNSIYTHAITWAICEKKEAKRMHITKNYGTKKRLYDFGDRLDKLTRYQKNNETNGIVVGPFTSRIISEIVLARIDSLLRDKNLVFKRYVDDYHFYFRSKEEAEGSIQVIERVINEYGLNLNMSKTEIKRFPFDTLSQIKEIYTHSYKKDGVFGVLNAAGRLYDSGEKGAYKYALKYIRKRQIEIEQFDLVLPILFNIMLSDPRLGNFIVSFLKQNIDRINRKALEEIANEELRECISQDLQQEVLLFIYLIRELELKVDGNAIEGILKSDNDFAIIIALDI